MGQYCTLYQSISHLDHELMNTQWQCLGHDYQLFRFPPNQHDKSLQAWDSADDLLISHVSSLELDQQTSIILLNDTFGALAVGLNQYSIYAYSDSYISNQAIMHNCTVNNLVPPTIENSLSPLTKASYVVIKITKNLDYLAFQLEQVRQMAQHFNLSVNVIAAGKTTLITSAVMALFEKHSEATHSSLAKKKSRLVFATFTPEENHELDDYTAPYQPKFVAQCNDLNTSLYSYANVFCKDKIDIGGRFLAENLPVISASNEDLRVIDLGCGNGLLGMEFLRENRDAIDELIDPLQFEMIFCDESYMAVRSAFYNVQHTSPNLMSKCEFVQDDCLSQQPECSADIILCNPPFHQQQAITTHISEQMISQAAKVLKADGELYLVANRHLPYQSMLKNAFGDFRVVTTNNKFVLYHCIKQ